MDEEPAQLLTPAGRVVVSTEVAAEPLPDTDQRRDVLVRSRAGADPLAFTTTTAAEERTRFLATILGRGSGLLLVVGTGTDISDAAAGHVQDALLLGGPPAAATAGVGTWLLAGAALRPAAPSRRRAWASAPSVGQVLLPGVSVLTRLVSEVREAAATRVHTTLAQAAEGADPSLPGRLRALLRVPEGARCSELERLRRAPRRSPGPGPGPGPEMVRAWDRVSEVAGLGAAAVDVSGVPANRVMALARHGWAARLRRWPGTDGQQGSGAGPAGRAPAHRDAAGGGPAVGDQRGRRRAGSIRGADDHPAGQPSAAGVAGRPARGAAPARTRIADPGPCTRRRGTCSPPTPTRRSTPTTTWTG